MVGRGKMRIGVVGSAPHNRRGEAKMEACIF
jgi:hypothetical protein